MTDLLAAAGVDAAAWGPGSGWPGKCGRDPRWWGTARRLIAPHRHHRARAAPVNTAVVIGGLGVQRWRVRGHRHRRPLSDLAPGPCRGWEAHAAPEASVPDRLHPPSQGRPARRGGTEDAPGADPGSHRPRLAEERERQTHRARMVEPTRQDLRWHDHHHRAAQLAAVATDRNVAHRGGSIRTVRTAQLPLADAVAVKHERAARRPRRCATAGIDCRPCAFHRRRSVPPLLDTQSATYDS
jgi:hypothetical protein